MKPTDTTIFAAVALSAAALLACKKKQAEETPVPAAPAATAPATTTTSGLAGSWSISKGQNPGGGSYSGTVEISSSGDSYTLKWTLGTGESYGGVALERDGVLGVGWGKQGYGVVMYTISGGNLDGRWITDTDNSVGTEVLSGPSGLDGSYKITSARTSKGSTYAGTVNIHPNGDTYKIDWRLTSGEAYSGVGLKEGNTLVVGWGPADVGVVAYKVQGSTLDGRWAQASAAKIGTETLQKK